MSLGGNLLPPICFANKIGLFRKKLTLSFVNSNPTDRMHWKNPWKFRVGSLPKLIATYLSNMYWAESSASTTGSRYWHMRLEKLNQNSYGYLQILCRKTSAGKIEKELFYWLFVRLLKTVTLKRAIQNAENMDPFWGKILTSEGLSRIENHGLLFWWVGLPDLSRIFKPGGRSWTPSVMTLTVAM